MITCPMCDGTGRMKLYIGNAQVSECMCSVCQGESLVDFRTQKEFYEELYDDRM